MRARMLTSREQLGIRRRLRRRVSVLKTLGFLGFTAYVLEVATTATGPAIDIAFDIAVFVASVVHSRATGSTTARIGSSPPRTSHHHVYHRRSPHRRPISN